MSYRMSEEFDTAELQVLSSEISKQKHDKFSRVSSESVVVLEDLKLLQNNNNTYVNDMSLEQCCTVTGIKREWFGLHEVRF